MGTAAVFYCLFGTFMVFFIIGLPTFLMGCNQSLSTSCVNYNPVAGIVYDYLLVKKRCKSCKRCSYHDCYSSYAKFHFGSVTRTSDGNGNTTVVYSSSCSLETANGVRDPDDALRAAHRWHLDREYKILHSISDRSLCKTDGELMDIWIAGLTFLLLAGLVLLCGVGFAGQVGIEKYKQDQQLRAEEMTRQNYARMEREGDEILLRAQAILRDYHKVHPSESQGTSVAQQSIRDDGCDNNADDKSDQYDKPEVSICAVIDCENEDSENGRMQPMP
mmetsp:Transcript_35052/g.60344  ORF Transcript_35052/g.60344 Transcript_35052/m.60344 type:complete len:275 (+) Transcript_35052:53-877(+)